MKNVLRRLLNHDTIVLEAFLGMEVLILGLALVHPQNTFATTHMYKFMAYVTSEQTWGISIIIGAIIYFIAIASGKIRLRMLGVLCMLAFWGFMATGFYIGNPQGVGWLLHLGFVIGALWCILDLDGLQT